MESKKSMSASGMRHKPLLKCAGLGGGTSSIAAKKQAPAPKKVSSGIFAAKA